MCVADNFSTVFYKQVYQLVSLELSFLSGSDVASLEAVVDLLEQLGHDVVGSADTTVSPHSE